MHIAIIPARGESKRIPKKNIKIFHKKPIISWSILNAIKSKLFDKVVVSTDDKEIAKISIDYGAETPFIRNKKLSDDITGITDVIESAILNLQKKNWQIDSVCCILATSPLIRINDLITAKKIINENKEIDFVFTATNYSYSIFRSFKIQNEKIEMMYPQNYLKRSQDFEDVFYDAGQFYWGQTNSWLDKKNIFGNKSKIIKIPNWRVQDIDTLEDWYRAELIFKLLNDNGKNEKIN